MIRQLSDAELHGLILDTAAPPSPAISPSPIVDDGAVARILGMVDLGPLARAMARRARAPIAMTPAALRAFIDTHGEYNRSDPTGMPIGKRWAMNENAYPRRGPPRWWIVEVRECSPRDPEKVCLTRRPVKLLGDLGTMAALILVKRYRRDVLRFRSRSASWFAREAS